MPISKGKKGKCKKRSIIRNASNAMQLFEHPLSNIPSEVLSNALIKRGHEQKVVHEKTSKQLIEILTHENPLQVISIIATYGLCSFINQDGSIDSGYKGEAFNQSHVELLQAYCLYCQKSNTQNPYLHPNTTTEIFNLLEILSESFASKRFSQLNEDLSSQQKSDLVIQEKLRLSTQSVRNWGWIYKVSELIRGLCLPVDDEFKKVIGFSVSDAIQVFEHLLRKNENSINKHLSEFFLLAETFDGDCSKLPPDLEALISSFPIQDVENIEFLRYLIRSYGDALMENLYLLDLDDISISTGIGEQTLLTILNWFSIGVNGLASERLEYFQLDNPVWFKPVIKLEERRYFCAIPQTFFSFIFPIIHLLASTNERIWDLYRHRRSKFLEDEISRQFKIRFDGCEVAAGYKWHDEKGVQYENDLLIRCDSTLLLIEAKSGRVDLAALRGAISSAKEHVQDVLLGASSQSLRLKEKLENFLITGESHALPMGFPIDLSKIKSIIRLTVTLEDFAAIQSNINQLKEAGWFPADHPIAPCLTLADLDIVFEMLESKLLIINYFRWREEIESRVQYIGDEVDLLAVYLDSSLDIRNIGLARKNLIFTGMSKKIDDYYVLVDKGDVASKPLKKMTKWWRDICQMIEEKNFNQWSDVATILLDVSYEDQITLDAKFLAIRKQFNGLNGKEPKKCAVSYKSKFKPTEAVALIAFNDRLKTDRDDRVRGVVGQIFESDVALQKCLVIAVDVTSNQYPYSIIGVFYAQSTNQ
jgi:hypothetical protein